MTATKTMAIIASTKTETATKPRSEPISRKKQKFNFYKNKMFAMRNSRRCTIQNNETTNEHEREQTRRVQLFGVDQSKRERVTMTTTTTAFRDELEAEAAAAQSEMSTAAATVTTMSNACSSGDKSMKICVICRHQLLLLECEMTCCGHCQGKGDEDRYDGGGGGAGGCAHSCTEEEEQLQFMSFKRCCCCYYNANNNGSYKMLASTTTTIKRSIDAAADADGVAASTTNSNIATTFQNNCTKTTTRTTAAKQARTTTTATETATAETVEFATRRNFSCSCCSFICANCCKAKRMMKAIPMTTTTTATASTRRTIMSGRNMLNSNYDDAAHNSHYSSSVDDNKQTTVMDATASATATTLDATSSINPNNRNKNNHNHYSHSHCNNAKSSSSNNNNRKKFNLFNCLLHFLLLFLQMQVLPYCCNIFKRQQQQLKYLRNAGAGFSMITTTVATTTTTVAATTNAAATPTIGTTRLSLSHNDYYKHKKQLQQQPNNCATIATATTTTSRNHHEPSLQQQALQQQKQQYYQQIAETKHYWPYTRQQQQRRRGGGGRGQRLCSKSNTCTLFLTLFCLTFLIDVTTILPTVYAHATATTTITTTAKRTMRSSQQQQHEAQFSASLAALEIPAAQAAKVDISTSQHFKRLAPRAISTPTVAATKETTQTPHLKLIRNETLCKSIDIRNDVSSFNQLENCTVIEGFLLISLISNCHLLNKTFPLLTEITEFIVIYRIDGLSSVSKIFPNLSIIRGTSVFDGYSLVIYQNRDLQDIGLTKLRAIANGGVRIEKNLSLCYLNTIDWTQILASNSSSDIVLKGNRDPAECDKCPGDNMKNDAQDGSSSAADGSNGLVCKEYSGRQRYCWNSKACQIICPSRCRHNCIDEHTCCDESCLGGCAINEDTKQQACIGCRHYSIHNSTCIKECPQDYYSYLDRRCITAETCERIHTKFENTKNVKLVHYNGTCSTRCPDGYTPENATCRKCVDKCEKHCDGGIIDSFMRAKEFHGCTQIINSGLVISLKRGGPHLMSELEHGLASVHTIHTHLKVHLTYGLISLSFFKNLKRILGKNLFENRYSLYVLENNDLESIWAPNQTVSIENGSVFFHFNPKLCYSVIDALRPMLKTRPAEFSKNEVAMDSNGNKGSCNTEVLYTKVDRTLSIGAIVVITNPLKFGDERAFIGYQYYVVEDPYRNATKYSYKPCDDNWFSSELTKEPHYLFNNLQPYKTYAYYVKTRTISSEPRNAQSDIAYFRTRPSKPSYVQQLKAFVNSSSEIMITWKAPMFAHGNLTSYVVRAAYKIPNDNRETHNYCKDPLTINTIPEIPYPEKKPVDPDCKCDAESAKKTGSSAYDPSESEGTRQDEIEFENTIQNYIYVKQSNPNRSANSANANAAAAAIESFADGQRLKKRNVDGGGQHIEGDADMGSFLTRHIRSLGVDAEGNHSTGNMPTKWPPDQNPEKWIEKRLDANNEYYEVFVESVNVTTTEFVFTKLKHFSTYTLAVVACRQREGMDDRKSDICSEVILMDTTTAKLENVDKANNLKGVLELTNTTRSNARLYWEPPQRPNGFVVSYTIAHERQGPHEVEDHKCITELEYRNLTNGYLLTGLQEGNYSIRVRVNTMAGDGIYTNRIYIDVPPMHISAWKIAGFVFAGVVLLTIPMVFMGYYMRKKRPPSDLIMNPTVNPFYDSIQYIPDEWEVPRERIIQLSPLGQGSFGMVYEGILKGYHNNSEDTPCAIKTVNEMATDRERMNFLNEASVMKQFDTFHVVRLLGVCSHGQPALVIMELMKNGDLKSYLRAHRPEERDDVLGGYQPRYGLGGGDTGLHTGGLPQPPPLSRIYQMAIEIADGMAYLAAKKFVHRDLAARNCMVASDLTVKIGDFGMTRDIYETDYYRKGTKGLLPVRWMPPESLRDGVYASSSDVFSYGVVLWEMVTLASQPYQGLSNDQVLRYVIDGGVMERPENCPDRFYDLMQKCWHHRPSARPTFLEIISMLLDMADPHFREVSFYHSEEGQTTLNKELIERRQQSSDAYGDGDNEMEDATTPLRVGEYHGDYKSNMENNSSVEHQGESPVVAAVADEEHPNSPYSIQSAFIVSSTPDRQSKNSLNLSQNNPTIISSAPSTSTGAGNLQQPRHYYGRAPIISKGSESEASAAAAYKNALTESEDRGYEIYDPSPNYHKMSSDYETSEQDEMPMISKFLPRIKGQRSGGGGGIPNIMPMSSSMPDDVIGGAPMSSSLHPSTASAASSNASSTAGTSTGRFPSLKRAVADTLKPARLRNIKGTLFNHKRTGSNTSHKSTSSNPNTYATSGGGAASSSSNTNLTAAAGPGGYSKSMSGQNLGTIESGGSGSAGSNVGTPRFFTPMTTLTGAPVSVSDNPNYKLLDETTANVSGFSTAVTTPAITTTKKSKATSPASGGSTSYQLLEESHNTSAGATPAIMAQLTTSDNPNYESMQPQTSDPSSSYMMMSEPPAMPATTAPVANISENPNYQMMGPTPVQHTTTTMAAPASNRSALATITSALRREQSAERLDNSSTSASSESDENDDMDDDDAHTEHIKMERMPLSHKARAQWRGGSSGGGGGKRSRSASQTKKKTSEGGTQPSSADTSTQQGSQGPRHAANTFNLKENWLRQQQPPRPPPPNGFIGREA